MPFHENSLVHQTWIFMDNTEQIYLAKQLRTIIMISNGSNTNFLNNAEQIYSTNRTGYHQGGSCIPEDTDGAAGWKVLCGLCPRTGKTSRWNGYDQFRIQINRVVLRNWECFYFISLQNASWCQPRRKSMQDVFVKKSWGFLKVGNSYTATNIEFQGLPAKWGEQWNMTNAYFR